MTEHHHGENDVGTPTWPRDFDIRASRAEQQELLAPLTNKQQLAEDNEQ